MDFDQTVKILGLIAGYAGVVTLAWRWWDARRAFLRAEVTAEAMRGHRVKIRTAVENPNITPRWIKAAFLVIGPEDENVEDTANHLLSKWGKKCDDTLNEMVREITSIIGTNPKKIIDGCRMIIPLAYYYHENVDVADEKLSYEHVVPLEEFPGGVYSVRFYLDAPPRLYRVVHATFEV